MSNSTRERENFVWTKRTIRSHCSEINKTNNSLVEKSKLASELNNLDMNHNTALMAACIDDSEMMPQLLKLPEVDVNQQTRSGDNALIMACQFNKYSACYILNDSRIDLSQKHKSGWNALMFACKFNYEIVPDLLQYKEINVNQKDSHKKENALMLACVYNHKIIPDLLKHPDLDINAQDRNGVTALMRACLVAHKTQTNILYDLLSYSEIDLHIKNNEGANALAIAQTRSNKSYELLKNAMDREQMRNQFLIKNESLENKKAKPKNRL